MTNPELNDIAERRVVALMAPMSSGETVIQNKCIEMLNDLYPYISAAPAQDDLQPPTAENFPASYNFLSTTPDRLEELKKCGFKAVQAFFFTPASGEEWGQMLDESKSLEQDHALERIDESIDLLYKASDEGGYEKFNDEIPYFINERGTNRYGGTGLEHSAGTVLFKIGFNAFKKYYSRIPRGKAENLHSVTSYAEGVRIDIVEGR